MHPRNAGPMPDASGRGTANYPTCGDVIRTFVRIDKQVITAAMFQACGCGPGIACASFLTEMVRDMTVVEAMFVTPAEVAAALDLPQPKMHCAQLAVSALQEAILDHQRRELLATGGDEHAS
jgi:nitrogen fixation NifU-like protein